jgi:glycosyltransferase involved in cell wall biosynthesis
MMDAASPDPAVMVIVPAHQAAGEIGRCLDGLKAAGFPPEEILVVDDGSRDGTGDLARAAGVRVIRNDSPLRPARARNAGVAATRSDIVVFVDADVVVHPGARQRITDFFRSNPDHVALFGSYDDDPSAPRPVSRYRNLLHHYVHQRSNAEAGTFWTGFGAVRRQAFDAVGGLDPAWENIEDVEFGLKLKERGWRIRLDRDLLSKHLKDWTLGSMFRTDWKGRAVPWTRLIRGGRTGLGDLNLSLASRLSAGLVAVFAVSVLLAPLAGVFGWVALAALGAFVVLNLRFLALLAARGGIGLALASVAFHALHQVAALLGFVQVTVVERFAPRR